MQLVLDARVLSMKITHCKQRLQNSRFIKISFEPFQDLFFDFQHGDRLLENTVFADSSLPAERKETEAGYLGGIFSIIGTAEEFSKNDIESNMLNGQFKLSVVGSGLQETFRTVPIDDLRLKIIESNYLAEKWKFYQLLNDLQVREIYGYKQIHLDLYPCSNLSQESSLSVGNIDIFLSIISVERRLTRVEEVGVSCNIVFSTTDVATSTTSNSNAELGKLGYRGYELDGTASSSDTSDSDNSIDEFIAEFYKKYGEVEKPTPRRNRKVEKNVILPLKTESGSDVSVDNSGPSVTNCESEDISTIANRAVVLEERKVEYQPTARVPTSELYTSRPLLHSRRSKLRKMPPKSSARTLLSVVPAPNALKKTESQQDEFYPHHHRHSAPDNALQSESTAVTIPKVDKKTTVTSVSTARNHTVLLDESHSPKRIDNPTYYRERETLINFPSRSRVRVLIKEEEEVTRIFPRSDTNRIFESKRENVSIDRSAVTLVPTVVVAVEEKFLPVPNPEYMSLVYEI